MPYNKRLAFIDFTHQRNTSVQRGIKFEFTLEQWINWWIKNLGAKWQTKRGRKKGQYCMSRNNDIGPYAPWNVECCLTTENTGRANRGEGSVRTNLINSEVLRIFNSKKSNFELAHLYKTSERVVNQIKTKQTWKHLTNGQKAPRRYRGGLRLLTEKDVISIYSSLLHSKELSKKYNVSCQCIDDIRHKRRWKQTTANLLRPRQISTSNS